MLRVAASLDQDLYCRPLSAGCTGQVTSCCTWSTEVLPRARLWASRQDLCVTPTLRGFTGQCRQLTCSEQARALERDPLASTY